MELRPAIESLRYEGLKNLAAQALAITAHVPGGAWAIEHYASPGGRVTDERLATSAGGIAFENPLVVGAGWDKTGRAVRGLHALGFAGVEVGTVTAFPQPGHRRPRLWTIDSAHRVGINRMGFNSPGVEGVWDNLLRESPLAFPLGINIGLNKLAPHSAAPELHAVVAKQLYEYADYFVINPSSPNTPGLRKLQAPRQLQEIIVATNEAMEERDACKPLFVKISPDLKWPKIDDIIAVTVSERCAGIIAVNTTTDRTGTESYGRRWPNEAGGLSGAHPPYERRATEVVRYARQSLPPDQDVIGVGGVHDLRSLLDKLEAGASVVQLVTAIRASRGRIAAQLNKQLLNWMDKSGVGSVRDIIDT